MEGVSILQFVPWNLYLPMLSSRYCASLRRNLANYPKYQNALSKYRDFLDSDPIGALRILSVDSVAILYSFFDWILKRKVGKDGRKLRGIKKRSTLGTYWKVFRLFFEMETGDKLCAKLNRKMHRVPTSAVLRYGKRANPSRSFGVWQTSTA